VSQIRVAPALGIDRIVEVSREVSRGLRSTPEEAIDANADECAAHEQHTIQSGLSVRIDDREDQEGHESAGQGGQTGFEGNAPAAAGASVVIGQVPLAAGTCSHLRESRKHNIRVVSRR
jgi:hypothetical protein